MSSVPRMAPQSREINNGKPARRLAVAARGVQQVLGDHQDAVVALAWLADAAGSVPSEAAYAGGLLAAGEASRALRSKQAWPGAWKKLRRARDRVRETLSIPPG